MKNNAIYMIRHGETAWNQKNLLQGRQDIPLSENGFTQAYEMSLFFKSKNLDFIGASPLTRAQQTASILSKMLNIPIKTFDELQARQYGPWEGKAIDSIRKEYKELFEKLRGYSMIEAFSNSPLESIESYQSVFNRAFEKICQIEENVLLVTHGGILTSILLALKFPSPQIPLVGHMGYIKLRFERNQLVIDEVRGLTKISAEPMVIF